MSADLRMTGSDDRSANRPPPRWASTGWERLRGQRVLARRVAALATAAIPLAAATCNTGSITQSRSPDPRPDSASASATVTAAPSPSDEARYPNLSRFTDPFDRFAYKSAYSDCRVLGVEAAADAYGGLPDDPSSAARAYAVATFPQSEEHREATFHGCLDAFETEAE
jgi:hypothetical protein